MTNEEAIITCQMVCDECKKNHIFVKCIKENCANFLKIKALGKQIPKKPITTKKATLNNGTEFAEFKYNKVIVFGYWCPTCDRLIPFTQMTSAKNLHHCECGQAIDWSDEK